jgi:dTDP-glucose 4,6-dehydratase
MRVLVTGGAGFIGSCLTHTLISSSLHDVLVIDKLTYAGNFESLRSLTSKSRFSFLQADICDSNAMKQAFEAFQPAAVFHLAAESHVDRSIHSAQDFVRTNCVGTHVLLEAARQLWTNESVTERRFIHVSTDEVYGSLGDTGFFTEQTSYDPRSPYSATKAASDHLARAWFHTYGLPVIVTNCSNNYGPRQFPEKLIPLTILNCLQGKPIPVYGRGHNVRDWLYVQDHVSALLHVMEKGRIGQTYNIGGSSERRNIDVVERICETLDTLRPKSGSYKDLISSVPDRLGHDFRYAIDCSKLSQELGWSPSMAFEEGLSQTVEWYLKNEDWWRPLLDRKSIP